MMTRPAQIAESLGRRIVNGELPPGLPLPPETELLEQLGVSRTTLREAFKILSAKGLVNPKPKVGTLVCPRTQWSMLDGEVLRWLFDGDGLEATLVELFEIRGMIETEAAGMAAANATEADLARIAAAFADLEAVFRTDDPWLETDAAFHSAIFAASGNRFMVALSSLGDTALRATSQAFVGRPNPEAIEKHGAVQRRIAARDPEGARAAMRELMTYSSSGAAYGVRQRRQGHRRAPTGPSGAAALKRLRPEPPDPSPPSGS